MSIFNFKTATPVTTGVTTNFFWFGAASQAASTPSIYSMGALTGFLSTATLDAGTITTSQPLTLTQTWNAGGVTFNALIINATNTASASGSALINLQVGGASKFTVTRDSGGAGLLIPGAFGNPGIVTSGDGVGIQGFNQNDWKDLTLRSASLTGVATTRSGTATPAAASAVAGVTLGSALVGVYWGTGSPNTALTAPKGSLYLNTTGSGVADRAFINTDGSTAWTAIATAG